MKLITIGDFLTKQELETAIKYFKQDDCAYFAQHVCNDIIKPNMERINKALGQENVPMYLAYMVQYVLQKGFNDGLST